MTLLETKLNEMIKNCEQAQITLQCVDSFAQHKALRSVAESSVDFFNYLENAVALLNVKEIKDLSNRETILKLYYIVLRSIYLIDSLSSNYMSDERSHESSILAQTLLISEGYLNKFSRANNWIRLDVIYTNGILLGFKRCHKTNIQSILRCLTERLSSPDIVGQQISGYLEKFESSIFYYLKNGDLKNRLYLPFY